MRALRFAALLGAVGLIALLPRTLRMRAFDNQGEYSEMRASVDEAGVWTFAAATMRTTVNIDPDGKAMAAKWERSPDGVTWDGWMDMEFAREA